MFTNTVVKRIIGLVVVICALALSASTFGQDFPKIVDTGWLAENLYDENMRIIDMRDSVKEYWAGHIPGAVYLSPDSLRLSDHGVPEMLVSPKMLSAILGRLGIGEDTLVIAYSSSGCAHPPYLVWALDYIGHRHSAVLDGGFDRWEDEGLPTTQDFPRIEPVEYPFPKVLNIGVYAHLQEVRAVVEGEVEGVLLDVRSFDKYFGESGPTERKGHIRGAVHHFYAEDFTPEGIWRSKEELEEAYEGLGLSANERIIVYCMRGVKAASVYLTLKYILGYEDVANYDASFSEWENMEELPVESGLGSIE